MDTSPENNELFQKTFMARQPVFDENNAVWGYEYLFRDGFEAATAEFQDQDSATLSVTANILHTSQIGIGRESKILINFAQRTILEKVPYALPAENTVVEVSARGEAGPDLLDALEDLKADGYMIALDDYEGKPASSRLLELADVVIIDVLDTDPVELESLAGLAASPRTRLLAKRVEDAEMRDKAKKLGFSLFQGFFFKKPKIISGRKLTSNEASRLKLLKLIQAENPNFPALADIIKTDVSISYRLLTYLNSPFFAFSRKISSIEQAVVLLGWKQIRNWLRVIILSDIAREDVTSELPYHSVQRGRFFELTADAAKVSEGSDAMFLLGLFSLLEPMLGLPMEEVVGQLPIGDALKAALQGEKNEFSVWLELASAFEAGDWDQMDQLLEKTGLDPATAARCYAEAMDFTANFFKRQAAPGE